MIRANELWDLYKDVDNNVDCLNEQTWTLGQREELSWRNTNPTLPDTQLIEDLEYDITVLQTVIGKLKRGWGLA